ncbi:MAG: TonB family protein [Pseudomonadota bacterium]
MSLRWWHFAAALVVSVAIHGAVDLWLQNTEDQTEIAGVTSAQIDVIGNYRVDALMEGGEVVEEIAVPAPPTPVKARTQAVLKPVEQAEILPSVEVESTMAAAIAETQTANAIIAAAAVDSPEADQMGSAKPAEATDTAAAQAVSASRQTPQPADQTRPMLPFERQPATTIEQPEPETAEQQAEAATAVTDPEQPDNAEPAEQQIFQPTNQSEAVETRIEPAKVTPAVTAKITEIKPVEQAEQPTVEPVETAALIRPIEPVPIPKQKPVQERKSVEKKKPAPKKPQTQKGDRGQSAQSAKKGKRDGAKTGGRASTGKAKEGTGNASVSNYPGKVTRKLVRTAARYRKKGVLRKLSGTTVVRFKVNAEGSVISSRIVSSSGSAALDKAAMDALSRASPFPKIPAAAGRKTWNFRVPLTFQP